MDAEEKSLRAKDCPLLSLQLSLTCLCTRPASPHLPSRSLPTRFKQRGRRDQEFSPDFSSGLWSIPSRNGLRRTPCVELCTTVSMAVVDYNLRICAALQGAEAAFRSLRLRLKYSGSENTRAALDPRSLGPRPPPGQPMGCALDVGGRPGDRANDNNPSTRKTFLASYSEMAICRTELDRGRMDINEAELSPPLLLSGPNTVG